MQHSLLFMNEGLSVMVGWTAFAITFEQQVFLQIKLATCFVNELNRKSSRVSTNQFL
jgi:hypothetical protein